MLPHMLLICSEKESLLLLEFDSYNQFLSSMAKNGRGVFSITMVKESLRNPFRMYLYRNPHLYEQIKGTHGDVKIFQLNKVGMQEFNGALRGHTMVGTWAAILDIALINSYMLDVGELKKYGIKPHTKVEIGGKTVGLISNRWGLTRNVDQVDTLIATKKSKELLLADHQELEKLSKRDQLPVNLLVKKITNAVTPTAFKHLR